MKNDLSVPLLEIMLEDNLEDIPLDAHLLDDCKNTIGSISGVFLFSIPSEGTFQISRNPGREFTPLLARARQCSNLSGFSIYSPKEGKSFYEWHPENLIHLMQIFLARGWSLRSHKDDVVGEISSEDLKKQYLSRFL